VPPVFRPVVQAKQAPAPAPAAKPRGAPAPGPGNVVQSFWLEQNGTTSWQSGTPNPKHYQDSGRTQWESWWKPARFNQQLPVYEPVPVPKAPAGQGAGKKKRPTAMVKTAAASSSSPPPSLAEKYADDIEEAQKAGAGRYGKHWEGYKKGLRPELKTPALLKKLEDAYRGGMKENPLVDPVFGRTHVPNKRIKEASSLTPQEKKANRVDAIVANLLKVLDGAVGKFPKYGKGDSSARAVAREGCVQHGPDFAVDSDVRQEVYNEMLALEKNVRAGGTLHVVDGPGKNPPTVYDVTLHGDYMAANPLTSVILHIR
jgi:hypothetical protein